MEEALQRKLNRRNKKKGDPSTDPAAPVAMQVSGSPQPAGGTHEVVLMQGMIAASEDSTEIGLQDPKTEISEVAAAEAQSAENIASSPPLTFQPASGALINAQDEDPATRHETANMVNARASLFWLGTVITRIRRTLLSLARSRRC